MRTVRSSSLGGAMRIRRGVALYALLVCCPLALLVGLNRAGMAEEEHPATAKNRAIDVAAVEQAEKHPRLRWAVEFSPDGKTVAVSSGSRTARNSGELTLFDVETGAPIAVLERDLGVRTVAFSRDGKLLAFGDFDGYAGLVDSTTRRVLTTLPQKPLPIAAVAFSPDAKVLVTGCHDGTITWWDIDKGAVQQTLALPDKRVTGLAVSRDGRWLAISTYDGTVQLRDFPTLQERHALAGSAVRNAKVRIVEALAFSADSRTLVTGSWDTTLRLWDVETGKLIREYEGATSAIHDVAFSPDGAQLAVGDGGGEIAFWDVQRINPGVRIPGHWNRCFGVSYAPDGKTLASASWDGGVPQWDLDSHEPVQELFARRSNSERMNGLSFNTEQPAVPPTGKPIKFQVTSKAGTPVAGALVIPKTFTLHTKGIGPIPEGTYPPLISDDTGLVEIGIPELGNPIGITRMASAHKVGIQSMDVTIQHPDFAPATFTGQTGLNTVVLPEPVTIEVRAHRENETQLLTNLEVVVNRRWSPAFFSRSESDGVLTLRNVDLSSHIPVRKLRFVHFPEQGPALFSDLISLTDGEARSLKFDLTMKPGVRVEGQISDQVPRPVKKGSVVAMITRGTDVAGRWDLHLRAEIDQNGGFVFESLPAGEMLQIIALCEGWSSLPASRAELDAYAAASEMRGWNAEKALRFHLFPQLVPLQTEIVRPVIAMTRTATLTARVTDDDGRPEAGIALCFQPNHYFVNGSGNRVDQGVNDLDRQRIKLPSGDPRLMPEFSPNPFEQETDEKGMAKLSGFPMGAIPMEYRFFATRAPVTLWNSPGPTYAITLPPAKPTVNPTATVSVTRFKPLYELAAPCDAEGIFDPHAGIFVADANGSEMKRLTPAGESISANSVSWSGDGKWMAYDAGRVSRIEREADSRVFVLSADGGQPRLLSDGAAPSVSPGGKRIAFARTGTNRGVWIMSSDGPEQELVLVDDRGTSPKWSPDGVKIVYPILDGAKTTNLMLLNLVEGDRKLLFDANTIPYVNLNRSFAWSPDSKRIAFVGTRDNGTHELAIVDARGANHGLEVRPTERLGACMSWSPDGSKILSSRFDQHHYRQQLVVTSTTTKAPFQVLLQQNTSRDNRAAAYSPDGTKLAIVSGTRSYATNPRFARTADGAGR